MVGQWGMLVTCVLLDFFIAVFGVMFVSGNVGDLVFLQVEYFCQVCTNLVTEFFAEEDVDI